MTAAVHEPPGEGALVRRMHRARIREWVIAGASVTVTALGVAYLSPAKIGAFAYYTLLTLMLLNAAVALLQSAFVLFPVESLLRKIRRIERDVDKGRLDTGRLSADSDDVFACLTAGIDSLVSKLAEKARTSGERALLLNAMIQATPFTIYTVSQTGKVYTVVKDPFGLVPLLELKVGCRPDKETWGAENAALYLRQVARSFDCSDFLWFDLDVATRHLRGCVKRINDIVSLVEIGDLPAIDKAVAQATGASSETDYTHRQDVLKRFAASVAHDAKNVFAALKHLIDLNRSSTDPNVRDQVPVAEDAIRRGTNLMKELTLFAGEARLNLVCTPAAAGIRSVVDSLTIRSLLPENVQVFETFSTSGMPEIDLDADQAWKVGFNLVKNAVEAMKGNGGRIWVKVEPFKMTDDIVRAFRHSSTLRTGEGVLVTVTDDGPGIPAEMLAHVFEPYVSNKGEGRGIGLSTVSSIVDAHSGALRVKSSPGRGTSFLIFIPASRNTAAEIQLMKEVAPNGEILLVDDDPTILHTTSLVLRSLKIAAHPAFGEESAVAKLRSLRTRLRAVLVDANIGGANSSGLVRRIHDEFPRLPVIVVSGSPKETVDALFAGVPYDRFLSKPYSVPELSKAIDEVAPKA